MPESKRALGSNFAKIDATSDEDIARQIAEDSDTAPELTDEMLAEAEVWEGDRFIRRVGRPKGSGKKELVSLRLDREILKHFRASGPGWQTRVNDMLRKLMAAPYEAGYETAMLKVSEFAEGAAAAAGTAPEVAKPAARRGRRQTAKNPPAGGKRSQPGTNARSIIEAMMTLPNHTGPAAAIKKALAERGHDIPYTSIRHGLGQLATRNEVITSEDGKTWRYVGERA